MERFLSNEYLRESLEKELGLIRKRKSLHF